METGRTTLMPKNVKRFELKPWKFQVSEDKKKEIQTAATDLTKTFDPINEFPKVFPKVKDVSLPPLRKINHDIVLTDANFRDIPQNIKPKEAFMQHFKEKLEAESPTGRCYKSDNPSCCQMMVIAKTSDPTKARFIHDLPNRNNHAVLDLTPMPDQDAIRNAVARAKFRSKIDLSDAYHQIRINPEYEKHAGFGSLWGVYNSRVMQQDDKYAPPTMMKIMNHTFARQIGVSVHVYIDDIFIISDTYEQHVKDVREVLSILEKHKFTAPEKKSSFMPSTMKVLGSIVTR